MDFKLDGGSFGDTTATMEALTERGKSFFASMFGAGAVSATMPKSRALDMARFFTQKGFSVSE